MGKQNHRNLTEKDCQKRANGRKTKPIKKRTLRILSQNALASTQYLDEIEMTINVKTILLNLSKGCDTVKDGRLASLLGIFSQPQIICSIQNIPSIENMISHKNLKSFNQLDEIQSDFSFNINPSFLVIEDQPDLMLNYLIVLEKAFLKFPVKLSAKQNEKVVKGLWNLCIKFWEDDAEDKLYEGVDFEVEWGLFSLLNYNLLVSNRERITMREKLKQMKLSSLVF